MKIRNLTADRRPRKASDTKRPAVPQQGPRAGHEQDHLVPHLPPRAVRGLHAYDKKTLPGRDPALAQRLGALLGSPVKPARPAIRRSPPRTNHAPGTVGDDVQEPIEGGAVAASSATQEIAPASFESTAPPRRPEAPARVFLQLVPGSLQVLGPSLQAARSLPRRPPVLARPPVRSSPKPPPAAAPAPIASATIASVPTDRSAFEAAVEAGGRLVRRHPGLPLAR
jgi:hypothetical protein